MLFTIQRNSRLMNKAPWQVLLQALDKIIVSCAAVEHI